MSGVRPKLVVGAVFAVLGLLALYFAYNSTLGVDYRGRLPASVNGMNPKVLNLAHDYRKGTHVYVGTLSLPTPCHSISSEAVVLESYPEQVTLRIETSTNADSCTASTTPRVFKIAFQASKEAAVSAVLDGSPIPLEVEEVGGGERLSL